MTSEQLTLIAGPLPDPPYPFDVLANGWQFELNPGRIENSDTWVMAGQAVQRGGHDMRPWLLMLWMKAWQQSPCGSLPPQDELIAARIGMDLRLFTAHRDILMRGWYLCNDGRLYHPVVTELVERMRNGRRRERLKKEAQRAAAATPKSYVPGDSRGSPATGTGTGTGLTPLPPKGAGVGFKGFWNEWPDGTRKVAELKASEMWEREGCEEIADRVLAGLRAFKETEQWKREKGRFIPKPWKWLEDRSWEAPIDAAGNSVGQWHETTAGVRQKGIELGIGDWDEYAASVGQGPQFHVYRARVLRAAGVEPRRAA